METNRTHGMVAALSALLAGTAVCGAALGRAGRAAARALEAQRGARRGRREKTFVRDEIALLDAAEDHPEEAAAWREEIQLALAQLDDDQREAFLLKHVEEMGYEEMSELTGVGVSALKMRVKRACERLRVLLQEASGV